jgi:DNA repair photolyase
MTENNYLYGDTNRIFLNTNLGCSSQCSYCYLPELNIAIGTKANKHMSVNDLFNSLLENTDFSAGKDGTIISLGCCSECWDEANQGNTIELLSKLIPLGNPIQLSTKREVKLASIQPLLSELAWYGQLNIYISNSTISHWDEYEQKTTAPMHRFKSFDLKSTNKIPMYLYIKPVLLGITIKDIEQYISIANQYNLDIILGEMFTTNESPILAPIGQNNLYMDSTTNRQNEEYKYIFNSLSKHRNSTFAHKT